MWIKKEYLSDETWKINKLKLRQDKYMKDENTKYEIDKDKFYTWIKEYKINETWINRIDKSKNTSDWRSVK